MTRFPTFGAFALLASAAISLFAQQPKLYLQVTGANGRPVKGVMFSLAGPSSNSPPTDDLGKTYILLPADAKVGSSVKLLVKPAEYRLLPSDRLILPLFDSTSVLEVRVYKVGDSIVNGADVLIVATQAVWAQIQTIINQIVVGNTPVADLKLKTGKILTTDPYELGVIALYEGRYVEAEKQLSKALGSLTQAHAPPQKVLDAALLLGEARYRLGDYPGAIKAYDQAVAVVTDDPFLLNRMAMALERIGDYPGAETHLRRALKIREREESSEDLAIALTNLGFVLNERHQCPDAKQFLLRALTIWQERLSDRDTRLATAFRNVGEALYCTGDYPAASQYFEQELAVLARVMGALNPAFADRVYEYGMKMFRAEEYALAEPPLKRALAIWEQSSPYRREDAVRTLLNLARIKVHANNVIAADDLYSRALNESEPTGNGDIQITILKERINLAQKESHFDKAEGWQHRIVQIFSEKPPSPPNRQYLAIAQYNEAYFVYKQGQYARAEPMLKKALELNQQVFEPDSENVRRIQLLLDRIHEIKLP
jgi:tetratricopeptide (TPR) repeat protein